MCLAQDLVEYSIVSHTSTHRRASYLLAVGEPEENRPYAAGVADALLGFENGG